MSLSNCMSFREIYLNNIKRDTVKNFIQTMPVFYWLDDKRKIGLLFIQIMKIVYLI